ncbi:nickel-dependent hydrogenase large subunit [Geobacter metallireducens RCH3]|uniref:Bidirectional NAD-reducing hydrogenase, large subunit n=1 Tax=Geobacter metallireducens (strain ATCC 53774 / DSM 7210 / GS-15) TaxID=269799 RepID=Q39WM1_GEOMG|nr:Ni/Fe hydrogenase subunit alpha [Geobacter metallireducens]ABB31353.1 bidirectional NAD-reducing hydrogenase, large subunit [Geobacter metallireducens GS-15]EHP85679.1 nickel-dependent hydrogenase large subunit [Geobacter metallireducens RCH3]
MSRTITIDPVTRIEGHATITIRLDDAGSVADARLHVTEFRGFEAFCVGRSIWEMPGITARICGICPISHSIASARAGDAILGVDIPPAAEQLRRIANLASLIQSHALSFFHLCAADLLLGMDHDPSRRSLWGLLESRPDVARRGIRLRQIGQQIVSNLAGERVHPSWAVPGGVREPLDAERRRKVVELLPEGIAIIRSAFELLDEIYGRHGAEVGTYGDFPSLFAGLVGEDGGLEHYDGMLRFTDSSGAVVEEVPPDHYDLAIGERSEPWSYMKFPFYRNHAGRDGGGMFRVGPLARLNLCERAGTPEADRELQTFRQLRGTGGVVTGSFHYHHARLIEILHALERIGELLDDPAILDRHVRSEAGVNRRHGVGFCEAPRGTLFHDYEVDDDGLILRLNLLIATGQNNLAMNRTILEVARSHIKGGKVSEGILNRIEHGIRAYDPCLSCATHVYGRMPFQVLLLAPDGTVVDEIAS